MFALINVVVKVAFVASWLSARGICRTGRFAWRWPWTFMLTVLGFCTFLYLVAGEKTP